MTWGPWQILLVLVVILLLFGSKKLPDLSRSLGKSLGEFKKGRAEGERELEKIVNGDSNAEKKTDGEDKA